MKCKRLILATLLLAAVLLPGATVTVTAPAGGELTLGSTFVIKWTHSSDLTAASLVRLQLFRDTTKVGEVQVNIPVTQKSYNWKVGEYVGGTAPAVADYKIRVKAMDATYADDSAAFSIKGGGSGSNLTVTAPGVNINALQPKIVITNPHGGEIFTEGQPLTITWTKSGDMAGTVKIALMCGASVRLHLTENAPNNGSFSWTAAGAGPGLGGGECAFLIKVTSTDNKVFGVSQPFRLLPKPPVTIKARVVANGASDSFVKKTPGAQISNPAEPYPDPGPGKARIGYVYTSDSENHTWFSFYHYRSLIWFDLSSLPPGKTPISCRIIIPDRLTASDGSCCAILYYTRTAPFNGDPRSLFISQTGHPMMFSDSTSSTTLPLILKGWLANPGSNYGLLVIGCETQYIDHPWIASSKCVEVLSGITLEVKYQ